MIVTRGLGRGGVYPALVTAGLGGALVQHIPPPPAAVSGGFGSTSVRRPQPQIRRRSDDDDAFLISVLL